MPHRRRQRGRGAGCRRPAAAAGEGAAADVVMDSGRNSDCVERLAFKYMRKCKVESSTDSESDNNNDEGFGIEVSIPTSSVDVKSMDFQKLQFLDPYDGDSENTLQSSSSECDQKLACGDDPDPSTLRDDSMSLGYGLIPTGDPEGECWGHVPYPDAMEKVKTSCQSIDLSGRPDDSVVSVHCCCDVDMDSGMVPEDTSVSSGRFLLFGLESRVETSLLFPTNLMSEENSDFSMLGASQMKRKWGIRTEGEKARRKKPRVSGYMVFSLPDHGL